MANIGTFKKSGTDYLGGIVTLSVHTKNVRTCRMPRPAAPEI
jgi:uncharacterized protein (DUF736 family)